MNNDNRTDEKDIDTIKDILEDAINFTPAINFMQATSKVCALLEVAAEICGRDGAQFLGEAFNEVCLNAFYTDEEVAEMEAKLHAAKVEVNDDIAAQLIALGWTPPKEPVPVEKLSGIDHKAVSQAYDLAIERRKVNGPSRAERGG